MGKTKPAAENAKAPSKFKTTFHKRQRKDNRKHKHQQHHHQQQKRQQQQDVSDCAATAAAITITGELPRAESRGEEKRTASGENRDDLKVPATSNRNKRRRRNNNNNNKNRDRDDDDVQQPPPSKRAKKEGDAEEPAKRQSKPHFDKKKQKNNNKSQSNAFRNLLLCETSNFPDKVLQWDCPIRPMALDTEESLLDVLVLGGNKSERGMMKSQPAWRQEQVQELCKDKGVDLQAALSLRRDCIQRKNPYKTKMALGLGREEDVRETARLFEVAVQEFLQREEISFWTEEDQKLHYKQMKKPNGRSNHQPATPDFVLKRPVRINKVGNETTDEMMIHWIEVKGFYGSSTIPQDGKSAVGKLVEKARKYHGMYGPGAILFMNGYGARLGTQIRDVGVMPLDCYSGEIRLDQVHSYQQTWCANEDGIILP